MNILCVVAHPDDPEFFAGATLARWVAEGHNVSYVLITGGQKGTVRTDITPHQLAELREGELRCAAGHLGLKDVFFLDYRDSGMPGSPDNQHPDAQVAHSVDEVAGKVVRYIREIKPDIVLTFDPIGGYRHPDHIHIHNATVMAFEKASDPAFHPESGPAFQPKKLFFHTFPRGFLKLAVKIMPLFGQNPRKFGRNGDIDMKSIAEVDFPTHARIDISQVQPIKAAASACHASQGGIGMRGGIMGLFIKLFGEHEEYMQAYPVITGSWKIKTDLI